MEEMRFESKYRDKFVTRTINHALPRPSWWRVRIEEIVEEMKKVKKGKLEIITRTPGDFPVFAVSYGKTSPHRKVNWPSATGSPNPSVYANNDPEVIMAVAGIHSEECEGIVTLLNLISLLETGKDLRGKENPHLLELCSHYRLVILPCVNMDGRAVAPDCLCGCTHDDYLPLHSVLKNGEQLKWPALKEYFPMPMEELSQLGTYYNSEGYNIMLDCAPGNIKSPEANAILQLADRERIDCFLNFHSCGGGSHVIPPSHLNYPRNMRTVFEIRNSWLEKQGREIDKEMKARDGQSDINIAVTLATGAVALTFEMDALTVEPFDNKLKYGYDLLEATMEHGLKEKLCPRNELLGK